MLEIIGFNANFVSSFEKILPIQKEEGKVFQKEVLEKFKIHPFSSQGQLLLKTIVDELEEQLMVNLSVFSEKLLRTKFSTNDAVSILAVHFMLAKEATDFQEASFAVF